ncbi:MAG: thiamine pyrophosphate-binding protein [Myxococcota bacterium]
MKRRGDDAEIVVGNTRAWLRQLKILFTEGQEEALKRRDGDVYADFPLLSMNTVFNEAALPAPTGPPCVGSPGVFLHPVGINSASVPTVMSKSMLAPSSVTVTDALAQAARSLGCHVGFGVGGAAIGRFVASLSRAGVRIVHPRHESAAGFMAAEYSLASDGPAVVFTTSGPGFSNAITGLAAAAWEGARVVAVVGNTPKAARTRLAFQSTSPAQMDLRQWLPPDFPFDLLEIDRPDAVHTATQALRRGASARRRLPGPRSASDGCTNGRHTSALGPADQ